MRYRRSTFFTRFKAFLSKHKSLIFGIGLVFGGALNVVAAVSAALSAYYTGQQSELALSAINAQSRNEAFADYLEKYAQVCKVHLTKFDEDLFITANPGPWAYEREFDFDFEVRQLDVDEVAKLPPYDVKKYISEKGKREGDRWDKLLTLRIWLDGDRQEIADIYPDFNWEVPFEMSGIPAPFVALQQQVTCLNQLEFLVALYKNPTDPETERLRGKRFWVVPVSSSKTTEDILKEWGREDILQKMVEAGVWPLPTF